MYSQIVTQKGVVKCENQILNKKIKQRNDRINYLEKENFDLKETVSFIIKLKSKEEKYNRATIKGNFVKIIKGGHSNFLNLGKQNTLGSNSPFFTISK